MAPFGDMLERRAEEGRRQRLSRQLGDNEHAVAFPVARRASQFRLQPGKGLVLAEPTRKLPSLDGKDMPTLRALPAKLEIGREISDG